MTFQSPQWLLALPVVLALVAFYVLLQVRRKAYAARFTNVALLGSIVPKRPGWRRHLARASPSNDPARPVFRRRREPCRRAASRPAIDSAGAGH